MATKTATKRRFEFVGSGSDKFWEISVSGKDVTVRVGRNGTNGKSSVKTLADAAAAEKHADKLINEKLGKSSTETA